MKKNNLRISVLYVLIGVIFIFIALFTETKLNSLFFGLAGAGIGPGLAGILMYLYWKSPKNAEKYKEILEQQKIDRHDELKDKVWGKTTQYLYLVGLYVTSISCVIFTALDLLEIIEYGTVFVGYLFIYLLIQILMGRIIFHRILQKYS